MQADYKLFESLKKLWVSQHPYATPQQYTKAIFEIARKCGI